MAYRGYKRIDNKQRELMDDKQCKYPPVCSHDFHAGHDKTDTVMQYINLLLEKQNFILSKFDHVDFVMSKLLKENDKIKEHIELLENNPK